jgi:hypothetical protein
MLFVTNWGFGMWYFLLTFIDPLSGFGCSHNLVSQKMCWTINKTSQNQTLNPKSWQSWQIVVYSSYECQGIKTKNWWNFRFIFWLGHLKVNTYCVKGCKQDTMSQHDYFIKKLHVFFPKFFFHINEFWITFGNLL